MTTRHVPICPECHHEPSRRVDEHYGDCQCQCHDVADASPELLRGCQAAFAYFRAVAWNPDFSDPHDECALAISHATGIDPFTGNKL